MALRTDSMPVEVKKEKKDWEVRYDKEGKGYCYDLKKNRNKKEINMDLNNDGKVDKKDISIAAKVLRQAKKVTGRK